MSELTKDQRRVLDYVATFNPPSPNEIRADLRRAFWELEKLGLIEPIVSYHLTDAGRAADIPPIPPTTGGEHG